MKNIGLFILILIISPSLFPTSSYAECKESLLSDDEIVAMVKKYREDAGASFSLEKWKYTITRNDNCSIEFHAKQIPPAPVGSHFFVMIRNGRIYSYMFGA